MAASSAPPPFIEPALGVVFDLDGTLVDSQHDFPRLRKTVVQLAERHGVPPGRLSITETVARLLRDATAILEREGLPEGQVFRFEKEVNQAIDTIEMEALPRTRATPNAGPVLQALNDQGFRLGLLTRSSEHFARSALLKTGLSPYFPFLRSRSSPGPVKPSPEALRLLLDTMGVPPDRAVLVGDQLLDCECAVAARVRFYGVLLPPHDPLFVDTDRFKAHGASAVAQDLTELAGFFGVRVPRPPAGHGRSAPPMPASGPR
ncbi:MAG: HAD family hydrolase [Thermoplasmata archaeon]|nr:HAD family hydrolase [Thermoplasmata archaeon]